MSVSKKTLEIAEILAKTETKEEIINSVVQYFKSENPLFNEKRVRDYIKRDGTHKMNCYRKTAIETAKISLNTENKGTLYFHGFTAHSSRLSALVRSFRGGVI